jgi:hypothetical protein
VGEDGLEVGLAERPHRPAGPVIVVEGPGSRAGHRSLLSSGVLAGGSLGAWPTASLLRSVLVGALGGRLDIADAVGGALLGLDSVDGHADSLPVSPLGPVARLAAEGPVGVGALVGAPVVLDLGGGLAPDPPTPSRLRHWAELLEDIAGAILLDGQADGPPLPGQGPHHLAILGAEVGVGLQPAVAALLVLAQLPLPVMSPVGLLGGHRHPTRQLGRLIAAAPQPAKHAARPAAGLLVGGQGLLGLLSVSAGPGQLPAAVAGGLIELAAEPVPLSPQLRRGQPLDIGADGGVHGQGLAAGPGQGLGQLR